MTHPRSSSPAPLLWAQLACDRDGVFRAALNTKVKAQVEVALDIARLQGEPESEQRCRWHVEALLTAQRVLDQLQQAAVRNTVNNHSLTLATAYGSNVVPEPNLQWLIEVGWLAWNAHMETEALCILGGVGGFAEGPMGRVLFQASALINRDREQEAADLIAGALREHADPQGSASATLAMLWRDQGNPRWQTLAQSVANTASDKLARQTCKEALKSVLACTMRNVN